MELDLYPHRTALLEACGHMGTKAALARAIEVLPQQIGNWLSRDKEIDPAYCTRIEAVTGGKVKRQALRPHDWQAVWPELAHISTAEGAAHA